MIFDRYVEAAASVLDERLTDADVPELFGRSVCRWDILCDVAYEMLEAAQAANRALEFDRMAPKP